MTEHEIYEAEVYRTLKLTNELLAQFHNLYRATNLARKAEGLDPIGPTNTDLVSQVINIRNKYRDRYNYTD